MMKRVLLLVMVLVFAASCNEWDRITGNYVIKVGEARLYKDYVEAEMATISSFSRASYQGAEGTARFVQELAEKEVLYQGALKKGLDKDKEFRKKLEATRDEAGKKGLKVDGVQPWAKNLLIDLYLGRELGPATTVEEKELKDFYNSHRYQVRISQIVVPDLKSARAVFKRLKAGENFAKVASEVSMDRESGQAGGDLGWFSPLTSGRLNAKVERIIPILRKGDVGGPITMENGIHIIKAVEMRPDPVGFDKVKSDITFKLTMEKRRAAYDRLLNSLKTVYKVEIREAAVAKLKPVPPPDIKGH